jgi:beta-mannosidase
VSSAPAPGPLARRELHDGWTLRAASGPAPAPIADAVVPASVPGVVHTDLLAAGLIPDPYLDDNEAVLAWVGLVDWTYETTFEVMDAALAASDRHELVFDGLDTVATVSLNGMPIAEVANQHRTHRIDVTSTLVAGDNRLTIAFRSPVREADARSLALGARPRGYPHPYEAIRKTACNFGWDWGIATCTTGIWRPARLESWSRARFDRVLVVAQPEGDGGVVSVSVDLARASAAPLTLQVEVAGAAASIDIAAGESSAAATVHVESVERWWPAGHGAQPLYDVTVRLVSDDVAIDEAVRRVGFRSVRWNMEPDAGGTPFELVVNDRPIWVKGVNWIPDDAFFPRVDRARYERRLRQAAAAHVNLVRVWGGGIYESDDFYDVCDELGLLTWQDFLFACAAYPEEEPLRSEVVAEARDNVARLAHRASLVLFAGNNENLWGYEDWLWKPLLDGATWGALYYHALLPAIVAELAPQVAYVPGSPFSPEPGAHPNDETQGATHLWEQWNRKDWSTYYEHAPRFVAEFGWQGPPTWSTLARALSDDPLTPESPGMIAHQKAVDGNVKLTGGLLGHFRVPRDFETWHWAMQLNQATAVATALAHFRSHAPHTAGAVVWQINDCWPVTSWAAIDGDEREKPLYHALRRAFAPRVVTIQPRQEGLAVVVTNDTGESWNGDLVVTRRDFAGAALATETIPVEIAAYGRATVPVPAPVSHETDAAAEALFAELGGVRGSWFYAEPRDSALDAPHLEVSVAAVRDGFDITVTADVLVRDLTLLVDKLDPAATVDTGLVTLLPGESATFHVTGVAEVDAAAAADAHVLRSANQLV